ncbi:protein-(glutamine-N5) methyltransferase, release factor-specific [Methylobacterium sp. Leaf465]|uniref:peptide chain release factor N(5)-glutamine methyltransferase n=1 Tax=Methylobacterium sp. Leaf465 TaxID=1736385 RepID=UPI0006F2DAF8|nr:peptide chain release factor N(5)-glutamine methyltransferase [Methylobacterium sp. Leaf465]KQT70883.1 protein-(glutamine-N5) methyltransferase, release factor-specific [Methylobacterium sp. Leaf465]
MRLDPGLSRTDALRRMSEALAAHGLPARDARFLLLDLLGLSATDLILRGHQPLGPEGAATLEGAVARRVAGEPVARIVGAWEFWGLPFGLAPETLVPRADTETLVEAALALHPDRGRRLRVLDLGTGSGCILVALLSELPNATGIGLDRSHAALVQARANAVRNGVGTRAAFVCADWTAGLSGAFDLIVSNPPYIARDTIRGLDIEVRGHDPMAALDGGPDGLGAYQSIVAALSVGPVRLAPGGALAFEVGYDQAEAVGMLGTQAGLGPAVRHHDLAGHARVVRFGPV